LSEAISLGNIPIDGLLAEELLKSDTNDHNSEVFNFPDANPAVIDQATEMDDVESELEDESEINPRGVEKQTIGSSSN
jgi:hypothetical protein